MAMEDGEGCACASTHVFFHRKETVSLGQATRLLLFVLPDWAEFLGWLLSHSPLPSPGSGHTSASEGGKWEHGLHVGAVQLQALCLDPEAGVIPSASFQCITLKCNLPPRCPSQFMTHHRNERRDPLSAEFFYKQTSIHPSTQQGWVANLSSLGLLDL